MILVPLEVSNVCLPFQAGPPGLERLKAMFAEDAVYSEPFSGSTEPHGRPEASVAAFAASRSVDFDHAKISVRSTCISKAIPGGEGSGMNVFEFRDGKIASLVTTLDMPDA